MCFEPGASRRHLLTGRLAHANFPPPRIEPRRDGTGPLPLLCSSWPMAPPIGRAGRVRGRCLGPWKASVAARGRRVCGRWRVAAAGCGNGRHKPCASRRPARAPLPALNGRAARHFGSGTPGRGGPATRGRGHRARAVQAGCNEAEMFGYVVRRRGFDRRAARRPGSNRVMRAHDMLDQPHEARQRRAAFAGAGPRRRVGGRACACDQRAIRGPLGREWPSCVFRSVLVSPCALRPGAPACESGPAGEDEEGGLLARCAASRARLTRTHII